MWILTISQLRALRAGPNEINGGQLVCSGFDVYGAIGSEQVTRRVKSDFTCVKKRYTHGIHMMD